MTDKELKKLSRFEILELLLASEKQNAELQEELEEKRRMVSHLNDRLQEKKLDIEEAGSIAEAALRVQGIFESAQAAANNYLENIKSLSGRQEAICAEMEAESRMKAQQLTVKAEAYSRDLVLKTEEECNQKQIEVENYCQMLRQTTEQECMNLKEQTAIDCQTLRNITDNYCTNLRTTTETNCRTMEDEIEAKCASTKARAKEEMETYWGELSGRMEAFYKAHEGMREMLSFFNMQTPVFTGGK